MLDIHNHSQFSPDSLASLSDMIGEAERLGLSYFGMSEHVDFYPQGGGFADDGDYEGYLAAMKKFGKRAGKTVVLTGLEFGFSEAAGDFPYLQIERNHELDFVINSVHAVDGEDCYFEESFAGKDRTAAFRRYLETVRESLEAGYDYQIVGHIGYVSRNAPYDDPKLHPLEFPDLVDSVLTRIIELDKTLELNSSSGGAGSLCLANEEILSRYYALGGRNVCFGSDAHSPERIADKYREVARLATDIGFTHFDVFQNRRRIKVGI